MFLPSSSNSLKYAFRPHGLKGKLQKWLRISLVVDVIEDLLSRMMQGNHDTRERISVVELTNQDTKRLITELQNQLKELKQTIDSQNTKIKGLELSFESVEYTLKQTKIEIEKMKYE